jgi:hypothetical protein
MGSALASFETVERGHEKSNVLEHRLFWIGIGDLGSCRFRCWLFELRTVRLQKQPVRMPFRHDLHCQRLHLFNLVMYDLHLHSRVCLSHERKRVVRVELHGEAWDGHVHGPVDVRRDERAGDVHSILQRSQSLSVRLFLPEQDGRARADEKPAHRASLCARGDRRGGVSRRRQHDQHAPRFVDGHAVGGFETQLGSRYERLSVAHHQRRGRPSKVVSEE